MISIELLETRNLTWPILIICKYPHRKFLKKIRKLKSEIREKRSKEVLNFYFYGTVKHGNLKLDIAAGLKILIYE